jgi:hypothetical protein
MSMLAPVALLTVAMRVDADIVAAHLHYAELSILETFYPVTAATNDTGSLERAERTWQSLGAARSCFDAFLVRCSRSPAACLGTPFPTWAQLAKSLVVLYRLSAWDTLATNLDRLASAIERAGIEAGEASSDDLYAQLTQATRSFRLAINGAAGGIEVDGGGVRAVPLRQQQQQQQQQQQHPAWLASIDTAPPAIGGTTFDNHFGFANMQGIDFGSDSFFQDFFGQL